ncbi:MAG: NADH-quinone oxidoreductase subunit L [Fimbriiglobus sp.]
MSDLGPVELAAICLALPLVSAMIAGLLGVSKLGKHAHIPTIVSFAVAAGLAGYVLYLVQQTTGSTVSFNSPTMTWFAAGKLSVNYSISVDPLSAVMLFTVTFVGTWIAIFSSSYMHDDDGYARYFAVMSLFVFAMLLLVLGNNFFVLVAGWEGVGLCSYLLVGYYYAKPSAAAAARKAFLVTRLGDVGLILGILMIWSLGNYSTNFTEVFEYIAKHPETHGRLSLACLLLFCGAVGKSAQLPLFVWLPDAMEGPTPVSALIHAATMVTAGVYLLARCVPLFVLVPDVQLTVSLIGGATALLAGFLALAQHDLKRVLAYSTVSQLGFMFMALGTGGIIAPSIAVTAAIFHLFTHAFFKALLFLGSGSVMHAMGDVIDMRKFGGLRKVMPITDLTFLAGSAALAGVPLLSGFWSKDMILDVIYEASGAGHRNSSGFLIVMGLAMTTAALTAFYTFRAYFLTFWGQERIPEEAHGHAHESPSRMTLPLIVLAIGAIGIGLAVEPLNHAFSKLLAKTPALHLANEIVKDPHGHAFDHTEPHFNIYLASISGAIALLGVLLAWVQYGAGGPEQVPQGLSPVYALSRNKLYVDDIYYALFVKPAEILATALRQVDQLLAGFARLVSATPEIGAAVLRPLQNGLMQFYALGMVLGLAVMMIVIVVRSTR